MSATIIARSAARGGYGAVARKQLGCNKWGATRSFSLASRLQEKRYAKSHEWIEYSPDKKTATMGISSYAAKSIGDVVFVELPEVGTEVNAEDAIGAIESVKSASDLYAPVTGTVTDANSALEETASLINKDPENGAWVAKLEVTGDEAPGLMSAEEYNTFTEELTEEDS